MDYTVELGSNTLDAMLDLVRRHTGIAMTERKRVLLEGRLRPRLKQLALGSYEQYLSVVQAGGAEVQEFINMVTTNDTRFFRTPAVWDYFLTRFLPQWRQSHRGQCLRIWSAAAASGEEAYSIAMLCQEFTRQHPDFRYRILASDISTDVLKSAVDGCYGGRSAELLRLSHPQLARRYFEACGAVLRVAPELAANIEFAAHNLLTPLAPASPFDLVFLRNVLIYFDEENQYRVLEQVATAMAGDARLLLGEQESITRLNTAFAYEQAHVYHRGPSHG
jgi:chemotaxis protein methyltransferase CheR